MGSMSKRILPRVGQVRTRSGLSSQVDMVLTPQLIQIIRREHRNNYYTYKYTPFNMKVKYFFEDMRNWKKKIIILRKYWRRRGGVIGSYKRQKNARRLIKHFGYERGRARIRQ